MIPAFCILSTLTQILRNGFSNIFQYFSFFAGLLDALAKGLLSDDYITSARILATNITNGILGTSVWWVKNGGGLDEPRRIEEDGVQIGTKPSTEYPW